MGGKQSKPFIQAMKSGDEHTALQLYLSNDQLRTLDPNRNYSQGLFQRSVTPLHLAAKQGFANLFREFMVSGGVASYKDSQGRTVAHHICSTSTGTDADVAANRAEMLQFLIDFCTDPNQITSRPQSEQPMKPQLLDLNARDRALNTPLHLAATSGLTKCVEVLLSHGAVVSLTNIANQTAFTCAEVGGHHDIMAVIQPKMIFSITADAGLLLQKPEMLRLESYVGMREQEMQEVKSEIILTTASILDIPMHSAEELLQHYGWSQQLVVDSWLNDPIGTCQKANVSLPPARQTSLAAEAATIRQSSREEHMCDICGDMSLEIHANEKCGHAFCKECWQEYLRTKIREGKVVSIPCPGHQCNKHIAQDMLIKLLPTDISEKYTKFDIGAFIEAHPDTRWCPHPGCERAVHLPNKSDQSLEPPTTDETKSSQEAKSGDKKVCNVDCGAGHFFCWACLKEAHDPCSCENWAAWKEKVSLFEGDEDTSKVTQNMLWIAKNSKPCPKCHSPIEKSDGCNHMTCWRCRHEFCWVCMSQWDDEEDYFYCNRFTLAKNVKEQLAAAESRVKDEADLHKSKYFQHIYTRYKNHTHSYQMEEALLNEAPEKIAAIVSSALVNLHILKPDDRKGKFVKDAIRELLKCRIVLQSTYALSYFLSSQSNRDGLVKLVAPLEASTEKLAEMVARPHLCTPRDKIILATVNSRETRRKYIPKAREYNSFVEVQAAVPLEEVEPFMTESPRYRIPSDSDYTSPSDYSDYTDDDWDDDDSLPPQGFIRRRVEELQIHIEEDSEDDDD